MFLKKKKKVCVGANVSVFVLPTTEYPGFGVLPQGIITFSRTSLSSYPWEKKPPTFHDFAVYKERILNEVIKWDFYYEDC